MAYVFSVVPYDVVANEVDGSFLINLDLSIDGSFFKRYSARYRSGDNIASITQELIDHMQSDIDFYDSEKTIFVSSALADVCTNIESSLVG
jgi:hypothetical protein